MKHSENYYIWSIFVQNNAVMRAGT